MQSNPHAFLRQFLVGEIHIQFFGRQAAGWLPHEITMKFVLISLKHWYLWFILEAVFVPYCQCMILHCPLVDSTHISPPVHFVWPTCLSLVSYALLNVIICTTHPPVYPDLLLMDRFTQLASMPGWIDVLCMSLKIYNYSIHPSIHSFIRVML